MLNIFNNYINKYLLKTVLFLVLSMNVKAQEISDISALIENEITSKKTPSLAVAVIDSGRVVHMSAHGLRDVSKNLKTTINTPFHVASVSKTVTNMAVFSLIEQGKIDLHEDVSNYLSFKVQNPHFPNVPITVDQLLKHRSGIKDNMDFYEEHWQTPKGDPTIKLSYLKDYLHVNGKYYSQKNYDNKKGYTTRFKYSNTGISLLGLIVEKVSGMPFDQYCDKVIFKPMKMENSSWFLKGLDSSKVAKTYVKSKSRGFIFKGHNGYPDYPAGTLRTSIKDYSNLIVGYLNADSNDFLLTKETTQLITPPSTRATHSGFYTWFVKAVNNNLYYAHGGGDLGVRTISIIHPEKKRAIIMFSNHPYWFDHVYQTIENSLWKKKKK